MSSAMSPWLVEIMLSLRHTKSFLPHTDTDNLNAQENRNEQSEACKHWNRGYCKTESCKFVHIKEGCEYTCVSSRHSRKYVTLLKLMTELIFFSKLLENLFSDHFFCEELQTDLIPKPLELFN